MRKFSCKIELAEPFGSASIAEFDVDGDLRGAIEWLMLAGRRDAISKRAGECIKAEHYQKEVIIRIDRGMASEVAMGGRIGIPTNSFVDSGVEATTATIASESVARSGTPTMTYITSRRVFSPSKGDKYLS